MKAILALASGSSTDDPVFATALAAARALAAHLNFYHIRLSTGQATGRAQAVDFWDALPAATQVATQDFGQLSELARAHVKAFCNRHQVQILDMPDSALGVSASFLEEEDHARERLMLQARHSDLVVLGRPSHIDYLPASLIEGILMGCGRPILIAPDYSPKALLGTVVVGWKETAHCARALSAAFPLLEKAQKVILLHLIEGGSGISASLEHLAQVLKWRGMSVETRSITTTARILTYEVARAAADLHADLLVVGAFDHRPLRESLLGGVTQSLIEHAAMPVFMMH